MAHMAPWLKLSSYNLLAATRVGRVENVLRELRAHNVVGLQGTRCPMRAGYTVFSWPYDRTQKGSTVKCGVMLGLCKKVIPARFCRRDGGAIRVRTPVHDCLFAIVYFPADPSDRKAA